MNVNNMPNEILLMIFNYTPGTELLECRRVCRRWTQLIDSNSGLSEQVWKAMCRRDYSDIYEDAYRKATLSYQELYKSLALWPTIQTAEMKSVLKLPTCRLPHLSYFQILKNSVIGIPQYQIDLDILKKHDSDVCSNAIVYYDLPSLQMCKEEKEKCGFPFTTYEENDDIVALVYKDELYIVSKPLDKSFFVGLIEPWHFDDHTTFALLGNEVLFRASSGSLVFARLEEKDDEVVLTTDVTEDFLPLHFIIEFSYDKNNKDEIKILTAEQVENVSAKIYSYRRSNKICTLISTMAKEMLKNHEQLVLELSSHGFTWTSPYVYDWMRYVSFSGNQEFIEATAFSHGDITIIGTARGMLDIYYKMRSPEEKGEPVKSFDLTEVCESYGYLCILKIDVVEIPNGHKVLVLAEGHVFVLEFYHNN